MEAEFNINWIGGTARTPGPADYAPRSTFGDGPKCSFRGRPKARAITVDPALVALKSTLGDAPKFSLGSRPHEPKKDVVPGPNYVPPGIATDRPRASFGRTRNEKIPGTPGPADYVASPVAAKAFGTECVKVSIRGAGHRMLWNPYLDSPGPAVYKPDYSAGGGKSPRWSIGRRYRVKEKESPGQFVKPTSTLNRGGCTFPHAGRPLIIH
jgi:hypothetical protein